MTPDETKLIHAVRNRVESVLQCGNRAARPHFCAVCAEQLALILEDISAALALAAPERAMGER